MPRMNDPHRAIDALVAAKGWILDIDGTLIRTNKAGGEGGQAIEGAAAFIAWLRKQGRPIVICTQASTRTPLDYSKIFAAAGLSIGESEIVTAGYGAAQILKARHPGGRILVLGASGITVPLQNAGLTVADPDDAVIDAVMIGHASSYEARWIDAACKAIEAGAGFYTTTDDFWFNGGAERHVAPTAVIAAAITAVIGVRAQVLGKPSLALGQILLSRLGLEGHQVVVVDDNIPHGIRLAHAIGAHSVMPLTGASKASDAGHLPDAEAPTLICQDVGELGRLLDSSVQRTNEDQPQGGRK